MPGIVGLVTKLPRELAEPQLLRMVEALRHESFYTTGTWIDESAGVYVGWVSRKNSFSDGMPLRNERGDVVLVFAGEEFPESETFHRLKQQGHRFDAEGPSYLVHLYEDDPQYPAGLNGRFQGFLIDRSRGMSMLFNDRYGMHRVYWHESREAFYFAAEAKAILAVRSELRCVDLRGLGELVSCGCVLENRTLFQGVHLLPSGSAWVFRRGSLERKGIYFEPKEWEDQSQLDPETYYQQLRDVFSRNLPRYFRGPERIGMSLTGGLDSRMIMAWLKASPGSLPCYTFGDGDGIRQCRDVIIGQRVAQACGQPHEIIPVGREFFLRYPYYAERSAYLTDGYLDQAYSPDLYLNEKSRVIAPVRMTGNYGSEVLRQSVAFKPRKFSPGLFRSEFYSYIEDAEKTYAHVLRGHPVSFAVFRQAAWHHYPLLSIEQTQLSVRSPFIDNDLVRTVFRVPKSELATNQACLRLITDGDNVLRQIPTDRGLNGRRNGLLGAASRGLLEFLFRAEYAYDSGMPQWLARIDHFFAPLHLERLFLGWHKFHHFRVWYRGALSGYVKEMLLDPRTLSRPYIEPRQVEAIVNGHLKGNRNYTGEIQKLLTLELLHRVVLNSN